MTFAAWMNRVLRYLLPHFEMRGRGWIGRLCCTGAGRDQAMRRSRAHARMPASTKAATTAVEISGPMPGTLRRRWQLLPSADLLDLARDRIDPLIEGNPVFVEASDQTAHPW